MKHLYPQLLFHFRQYLLLCITFVLLFGGPRIAKFEYPNLRPSFIFSFLNPTQETFVIHSVKSFCKNKTGCESLFHDNHH